MLTLYLQAGYSVADVRKLDFWQDEEKGKEDFNVEEWLIEHGLSLVAYLLSYLPLLSALQCYLKISLFKADFNKKLLQSLTYPTIQLLLAIGLSLLAQFWVLPLLKDMLGEMLSETGFAALLSGLLMIVNYTILGLLLVIALVVVVIKGREQSLYLLLLKQKPWQLFRDLLSYQFLNYYLIFYQAGAAIEEIINGLRKLPDSSLLNACADAIHFRLLSGDSLAEALRELDRRLPALIEIGNDTGKTVDLLGAYTQSLQLKFAEKIKVIGTGFQIFSYVYILLLVLVIYQMMMMPLALLEGM